MDTDSKPVRWHRALVLLLAMLTWCVMPNSARSAQPTAIHLAQADADLPLEELKPPETTFGDPGMVDLTEGQKTYAQTSEATATSADNSHTTETVVGDWIFGIAVFALAFVAGRGSMKGVNAHRKALMLRYAIAICPSAIILVAILSGGAGASYPAGFMSFIAVALAIVSATVSWQLFGASPPEIDAASAEGKATHE